MSEMWNSRRSNMSFLHWCNSIKPLCELKQTMFLQRMIRIGHMLKSSERSQYIYTLRPRQKKSILKNEMGSLGYSVRDALSHHPVANWPIFPITYIHTYPWLYLFKQLDYYSLWIWKLTHSSLSLWKTMLFICIFILYTLTHWGRVTHICVGNLAIIG